MPRTNKCGGCIGAWRYWYAVIFSRLIVTEDTTFQPTPSDRILECGEPRSGGVGMVTKKSRGDRLYVDIGTTMAGHGGKNPERRRRNSSRWQDVTQICLVPFLTMVVVFFYYQIHWKAFKGIQRLLSDSRWSSIERHFISHIRRNICRRFWWGLVVWSRSRVHVQLFFSTKSDYDTK